MTHRSIGRQVNHLGVYPVTSDQLSLISLLGGKLGTSLYGWG